MEGLPLGGQDDVESSVSNSRQAWKKTRARSRRLRFMIKNSLTSLAHNNVVFLEDDKEEEEESMEFELDERSEDSEHGDCIDIASSHNIDEAMMALHTLPQETVQTWKDAPETQPEYDWILDGDPEWAADFEKSAAELKKSQQLHQSLQSLELEDPMAELSRLDFDMLGRQENRFANFDDDFIISTTKVQEEEEEFGDFVSANNETTCGDGGSKVEAETTTAKKSLPPSPATPPKEANENETAQDDKTSEEEVTEGSHNESAMPVATITVPLDVIDGHANEPEPRKSVYNMFPLDDVSSPEGRFTRRRQLSTRQFAVSTKDDNTVKEWWCKSQEEMEEDLPAEYYTESFDGTLELLMDLPWEHVAFWQEQTDSVKDIMVVDEHVTQKLSQLDAAQAHVKTRLICEIQQRQDMLKEGNQLLHDMDHNLAMAHMYVHRGKESLDKAHGREDDFSGIVGMNTLLHDADRRDQLRQLKGILDRCSKLLETEESLELRIASFGVGSMMQDSSLACREYRQVIEIARQLQKDVDHDESLSRLVCLDQLRERACTVMESFRSRIDAVLAMFVGRACHFADGFSSCEYETLVRAMLDVHARQAEERKACNIEETDCSPLDPAQSWSQCILKSLSYEADKCLARALLDPSDEESSESSYDKELIHLTFELNNGSGDNAKLRTLMHNLVTIRFDFESDRNHLSSVYHKLCILLADVLHAHYLLVQWHKAPCDPRNKDAAYLHRTGGDEIPEEKKTDECPTSAMSDSNNLHTSHDSEKATNDGSKSGTNAPSNPQHYGLERAEHLDRISRELNNARIPLWRHCESVLVTCLDQYLHFSPKKNFFRATNDNLDDEEKAWLDDLERLHDIFRLTQQFLVLGKEFVGADFSVAEVSSLQYGGQDSELREKLCDVFRRHLRVVHVEAMNSTGAMLFHENWKLLPVDSRRRATTSRSSSDSNGSDSSAPVPNDKEHEAKKFIVSLLETYAPLASTKQRCWENRINTNGFYCVEYLPNYFNWGNPFLATPSVRAEQPSTKQSYGTNVDSMRPASENKTDDRAPRVGATKDISGADHDMDLHSMISSFLGEGDGIFPPLGTGSALKGLAKWSWRLLTVMKRLPIILEDTAAVFANIFDLYFTTVFRLCAGSALHERIVLGIEPQNPQEQPLGENGYATDFDSPGHMRNSSSSSIFGRRRRSSKTPPIPTPTVSQTVEADICAPLLCEAEKIALLSDFIRRGQTSLEGIVNLEKIEQWMTDPDLASTIDLEKDVVSTITNTLERRQGAAWSCLFVAALLDTVWSCAETMFIHSSSDSIFGEKDREGKEQLSTVLTPLASYVKSVVEVIPTLATLASRIACSRAVLAKSIVHDIISVRQWGESKVHVDSNDYIHDLTNRNTTTWLFLSASAQPLPQRVLDKTWEHLLIASYLAILDGFTKVCRYLPNFTAEGIALMSMDVVAFESGMTEIGARNAVGSAISRQRVSQWITALYLPDADLMKWIGSNYVHYQLSHILALITSRAGNGERSDMNDMIRYVKSLYIKDSPEEDPPPKVKRYHSC